MTARVDDTKITPQFLADIAAKYSIELGTKQYFRARHPSGLGGMYLYFPKSLAKFQSPGTPINNTPSGWTPEQINDALKKNGVNQAAIQKSFCDGIEEIFPQLQITGSRVNFSNCSAIMVKFAPHSEQKKVSDRIIYCLYCYFPRPKVDCFSNAV